MSTLKSLVLVDTRPLIREPPPPLIGGSHQDLLSPLFRVSMPPHWGGINYNPYKAGVGRTDHPIGPL